MTTLRVHFDGRALIPDTPVDLPTDRALEAQVRELDEAQRLGFDSDIGLPFVKATPGTGLITPEDIRRA